MHSAFVDYSRTLQMVAHFIATARSSVVDCINNDNFTHNAVEGACVSKFVGTSFAVDVASVLRKLLGSQALYEESWLGESSFVANATCAAEGDNTIMELKTVQDMVRGRTPLLPWKMLFCVSQYAVGRTAIQAYLLRVGLAFWKGKDAINDGQLLKELAWCRAHLLILYAWLSQTSDVAKTRDVAWMDSYQSVMMRFPMPIQC